MHHMLPFLRFGSLLKLFMFIRGLGLCKGLQSLFDVTTHIAQVKLPVRKEEKYIWVKSIYSAKVGVCGYTIESLFG